MLLRFDKFKSLFERRKAQNKEMERELTRIIKGAKAKSEDRFADMITLLAAFFALYYDAEEKSYWKAYTPKRGVTPIDRVLSDLGKRVDSAYDGYKEYLMDEIKGQIQEVYLGTCYEVQYDLGGWKGVSEMKEETLSHLANQQWFDGQRFSDRLWADKRALKRALYRTLTEGVALGKTLNGMVVGFKKDIAANDKVVERLIRTEFNRAINQAILAAYRENGVDEYEYVAIMDERTSEICQGLNGKRFKVSAAEPGVNLPPMHPNCVLGDSIVFAPDAEELIKSDYSGNVFEFVTAKGRRLSVTPNHIMLTQRGWVRAKNIVKGDKVVNYLGWDEIAKAGPTDDYCVPTIENLFASLAENGSVPSHRMPSSPEHLKGDASENGEIDIIGVNGLLGDEINPSLLKFLGDCRLVIADESCKGLFPANRSVAEFLVCVGLASDCIMSGDAVSSVFLGSSLGHHQLVGFRVPSDYDARLLKSASNDSTADAKAFCDSIKAFSGLISFDDVIDIKVSYFSGHVYDVSSSSTLYICNGIITSNCRSSTIPIGAATTSIDISTERLDYEAWFKRYVGR